VKRKDSSQMKGWKKYSPLVEIDSDSTLQQLQEGLIKNGHGLRELLEAVYPDADAICSAIEEIKYQLQDHPVDISDRWVTAHVQVGDKKRFISKRLVREVSMSLFFCFNCALYAFAQFFLSCLGDIAGNP
jgi:hypothetical protein